jgi:UDP-4-amino-4,6-dideoxy-N-acetyl-beta-L-altrosamine transaminase
MIRYSQQDITQEDIAAVVDVLKSVNLTQGPNIEYFEQAVLSNVHAKYAVAVNSATSALHISCLALDLGPGDWLWTTPNSFVASANCALYCGARVDFVDIDPLSYNISAFALEAKLIAAEKSGRLPKILVAVHFAGQSCDMQFIQQLAKKYDFKIIEDASHAIGAKYKLLPIGNCLYADITVFSFHPVKIITTGEGGMAVTNSEKIANQLRLLRSHGITRESSAMTNISHGPWYYEQIELGFNYRMTDIQAALGLSQIARLNYYVRRRQEIAKKYDELLSDLPVSLPQQSPDAHSSYHLYVIRVNLNKIKSTHLEVFNYLRKEGILVNLHYIPIHLQPYYQKMGFKNGDYPEAEKYYKEAISIPIYPTIEDKELNYVVSVLRKALQ